MTVAAIVDVTVRAVAAALLHSLWQGALVALVTGLLWWALRGSRPNTRYALGCVALTLMVSAWALTAWRTALQLMPVTAVAGTTAPPALGPAGPFDASPAIRTISRAELDESKVSWARRLDSWSVRLVPLWLVGVFGLSFRLALSWWVVQRLRRAAQTPVGAMVADRVQALAMALRVSRAVRVTQSAAVQVPAVIGWLRPIILLPASVLTGLSAPQLDAILAHELAHVRRHDFAANLLQTAAEILLFYHPACWWVSRRVRAERELCCDDIAVSLCGDRLLYATALAELESLRAAPSLAPALAATDGPLLQRVRRLLSPLPAGPRVPPGLTAALVPAALLALVVSGATITAAVAQAAPPTAAAADRTLPAGHGVVRGQIVDAQSGRPIAGASYEVTGPEDSALGQTGDDGRFETRPLKAGTYSMSARAKGYVIGSYGQRESPFGAPIEVRAGRASTGIEIRMQAAGAINGRILDDLGNGLQGVEIVLEPVRGQLTGARWVEAFAQTIENGVYRVSVPPGDYHVRAYVGEPLPAAKGTKPPTYVATFYPGVRVKEESQPLHVEAGLDLYDIDFTLATSALVRVRGQVVDPSGDGLAGIRVAAMNMGSARGGRLESFPVDAEGRFAIKDLVPGQYMFNVVDQRKTSRWVGSMKHLNLDADVDDLEMRASVGARVVGRIVRDPSSSSEIDFTQVRVSFETRVGDGRGLMMSGGDKVELDGAFDTESPGGPVSIGVSFLPDEWTVKSIHLDRVDVDGQTVDMSGGTRQLQIVVTEHRNSLSGVVVDRNGRTLPAYAVVLFSEDETRWTPSSRFIMSAQSSQTGQFRLKDVPAGDYYAVALQALPFRAWTNPDVLVRLQSVATRLKVHEGEQKVISIRASPTPNNLPVQ